MLSLMRNLTLLHPLQFTWIVCIILANFVTIFLRYVDLMLFKMAAIRHLELLKIQIFNGNF